MAGINHGVPALGIDAALLQKLLGGAVAIAVLVANCYLLLRLSLRWQITVVWCELALLVVLFFSTFNLSLEFIERKIGYLVLQGAASGGPRDDAGRGVFFRVIMSGLLESNHNELPDLPCHSIPGCFSPLPICSPPFRRDRTFCW
ncbi:hypothetical protein [Paraburkholderia youngii]|uniref:hypothetical protein n=1 Tax=Paraburkholderia youngii TaxID=2782701 RepID=UPI003D1C9851